MGTDSLYAWTRPLTGTPLVFHAYVKDRATGETVRGCLHNHTRRAGHSGDYYARRCAERMLRTVRREKNEEIR